MKGHTVRLEGICLPWGAVGRLSAEFNSGLHLIVGPNGIGKTSLLNCIAGSLRPSQGKISIDGNQQVAGSESAALVPGKPPEIPWIRAQLLLEFVVSLYPKTRRDDEYQRFVIEQFGVGPMLELQMGQLSAGSAKKILLAAALVASPPVMLLDEPANELDEQSLGALVALLAREISAKVVLVASHQLPIFDSLAPSIFDLSKCA